MLTRQPAAKPDHAYRRTVHLSDSKRGELIDRLDAVARRNNLFGEADSVGYTTPSPAIVRVTVHHPGGGTAKFLVHSRHYSGVGMWFLHSGFLNPGTRCVFVVHRGEGQEGGVLGTVDLCELMERNIHAVAVRFDSPIDPEVFTAGGRFADDVEVTGSVALPQFNARLLLLDDQRVDCELLAFHLRSTGVRMTSHEKVEEALNDLRIGPFDLVMCELNLNSGPGERAIKEVRDAGFAGPIIVITAETDPKRIETARQAGATAVIPKPYSPAGMIRVLAAALGVRAPVFESGQRPAGEQPRPVVFSTLSAEAGMIPLIEGYIAQVRRTLEQIAEAVKRGEVQTLRRLCLKLKGSGAGFGFGVLSEAAAKAVTALDAANSISEAAGPLRHLAEIGHRLALRPPVEGNRS